MSEADEMFLKTFLDEAGDILGHWEKACLELDREWSKASCDALFRSAHNLKGSSRGVGLVDFGGFVHIVEDVIGLLQQGKLAPSPIIIRALLDAQSVLLTWVERMQAGDPSTPTQEIAPFRERLGALLVGAGKQAAAVAVAPKPADEGIEGFTPFEEDPAPAVALGASASAASAFSLSASASPPSAPGPLPSASASATGAAAHASSTAASAAPTPTPNAAAPAASTPAKGSPKVDETIRISTGRLESLMQLVGELSIQQGIVFHARQSGSLLSKGAQNAIYLANKITKDIQAQALSLRMQPLQALFQRLERTLRDIARDQGKQLNVVLEGSHVELDKTVIERVVDPLVHIVRNAVDHGVEAPDVRQRNGKTPIGTIRIEASQGPSGVMIRVSDDGQGLNEERIMAKAIERGMFKAGAMLSPIEIHKLIFLAGFSTAEKVTDISGRGVGLDVVKRAVDDLGGLLDTSSIRGGGTTFSVSLPTSLSIIEALIVDVDANHYAIPIQGLTEIIDLHAYDVQKSTDQGEMISLRGSIVAVQKLSDYLPRYDLTPPQTHSTAGKKPALITRIENKAIAFEVDRVLRQQDIVVRKLTGEIGKIPGFSGSTILGDGEPGFILNLDHLARHYFESTGKQHAKPY